MPTCTVDTLANNAIAFRKIGHGLIANDKQRKAIYVYLKALELAAVGGTDYSADFTQLFRDAQQLNLGQTPDGIEAARVAIQAANATAAGATVPDLNGLLAAVSSDGTTTGLLALDDFMFDKIDLVLTCKLAHHVAQ